MNYHDAFGVPGVVTRMFNNYGPRQNPRYVTGHDHHAGAHAAGDRARRARAAARLLLLHRRRPRPPHRRRARASRATSTSTARARTSRWRDWAELILRIGDEHGFWPDDREHRHRRGALPPGRQRRDGAPRRLREAERARPAGSRSVSWEEGVLRTIRWYAENRDRWIGRVDWLDPVGRARAAMSVAREHEAVLRRRRARRARRHLPPHRRRTSTPSTGGAGRTRRPRITSARRSRPAETEPPSTTGR